MKFLLAAASLLLVISSATPHVEPSARTKARYQDLRQECEQSFDETKAKQQQAREIVTKNSRDGNGLHSGSVIRSESTKYSIEKEGVLEELQSMVYLSSLVYAYAEVRKTVREGGIKQSRWPWAKRTQLDHADIILENENDDSEQGSLKHELSGKELQKLLTPSNMERLANDKEIANRLNIEAIIAMKNLGEDGILWEFDDTIGDNRDLVYAITVNQIQRRVTVIFRGSVSGQDWIANLTVKKKRLKLPECLEGLDLDFGDSKDPVAVHSGFYKYLDKSMGHLLKNLKSALKQHPGYEVVVTGHSLGGALASLLAYRLVESDTEGNIMNLPVACISFAAPLVGNRSYQKAFQHLERMGRLEHVRVTNRLDVVPLAPPLRGYVQTGVNFHLVGEGMYQLTFSGGSKPNRKTLSFWSQLRPSSVAAHSLLSYWQGGQAVFEKIMNNLLTQGGNFDILYISDLYRKVLLNSNGDTKRET